tara:strand:- start:1679 stop:1861 length:183 start_codon:yes stop_codon:yes gene_type:complete
MQPRLQPRSSRNSTITRSIIKILLVLLIIFFGFFFIEKIDLPTPQKEITEDVTNKNIKLK